MDILSKIYFKVKVFLEGGEPYSKTLREYYSKKYNIKVGYGSYGGCFDPHRIPPGTQFGNYCSIAEGVTIFRANHPLTSFTSHPIFYNPNFGIVKTDKLERPPISIGHDVWLGYNSIILPSVRKIGNGAVVGAGAVVTKDIEPYSVVVGNPARHVKYRFSFEIIRQLEDSNWFCLPKDKLVQQRKQIEDILSEK